MIRKFCFPALIIITTAFIILLVSYLQIKSNEDIPEAVPKKDSPVLEEKDTLKIDLKDKLLQYLKNGDNNTAEVTHTEYNRLIPDIYPVKSEMLISQAFSGTHNGIDWAFRRGEPVFASAAGHVIVSANEEFYGNLVVIDHLNGYKTYYGHLQKILVEKGSFIEKGAQLGLGGSTGYSTGPHLHYSISKNDQFIDPETLWKK